MTARAFGVRRIVVALDGSVHGRAAPETAAALAARLHAELECVFVQDVELARLAALPVGREIQFLTGRGRDFTAAELSVHNQEQEACARQAIAAAAARARVSYAFRVARGEVRTEVLAAAVQADLLIVGAGSLSPGGRTRLGGTARAAAEHAPGSVMISRPGRQATARALVVHDGSAAARRALQAATGMFGAGEWGLAVMIDSDEVDGAHSLRRDVASELEQAGVKHRFLHDANPAPDRLCRLASQAGADVLVLAADSRTVAGERRLRLLETIDCPVLLVR